MKKKNSTLSTRHEFSHWERRGKDKEKKKEENTWCCVAFELKILPAPSTFSQKINFFCFVEHVQNTIWFVSESEKDSLNVEFCEFWGKRCIVLFGFNDFSLQRCEIQRREKLQSRNITKTTPKELPSPKGVDKLNICRHGAMESYKIFFDASSAQTYYAVELTKKKQQLVNAKWKRRIKNKKCEPAWRKRRREENKNAQQKHKSLKENTVQCTELACNNNMYIILWHTPKNTHTHNIHQHTSRARQCANYAPIDWLASTTYITHAHQVKLFISSDIFLFWKMQRARVKESERWENKQATTILYNLKSLRL